MKHIKFLANLSIILLFLAGMWVDSPSQARAQTDQIWSDPINLSNSGASTDPSVVVDARGGIHVIWVDAFDGYKYVESADGVTWTSPVTVPFPFLPEDNPRPVFLTGADGEIHILWQNSDDSLFYSRALPSAFDSPSAWVGTITLAQSVASFNAVVDSRGTLHVGLVSNLGTEVGLAGIYYRRLSGSSWSVAVNLYSSQYFRALEPKDANVRIAVSNQSDHVYVVWDDRPQKRIFMTRSIDGGSRWEDVSQVRGPETSSGLEFPYNINVGMVGDAPLLIWQFGLPGSYCTTYSQSSLDGEVQFGSPMKLVDEFGACPQQSDFIMQSADLSVVLMNTQDDISLIAWNGSIWSRLQVQSDLSTFINPATFDNVLFGCQNVFRHQDKLFVVGCDMGGGGDIWFRARVLGALEDWFPPPSAWTLPTVLTSSSQKVSALSSVADDKNTIHLFWTESQFSEPTEGKSAIFYARWDGKWSEPRNILSGLSGAPSRLPTAIDNQGRLLLSWVEGESGDLYFSWANAERANIASEWSQPKLVPTTSPLSSSPDILVDDSGKIVIVYSIPLNEDRGIYVVQSDDLGKTWTSPLRVLNAVEANWDTVDQPAIRLSSNGWLHAIFSRYSIREVGKSEGLYYSHSVDGGISWSQPHAVSERHVQWSRMVYLNDQTLHLVWQEKLKPGAVIYHQVSRDSGMTWENPITVSTLPDDKGEASLTTDAEGRLHIIQAVFRDENLALQFFTWSGSRWNPQDGRELETREGNVEYSISAAVASQGTLHVILPLNYPGLVEGAKSEVLSISRSLGEFNSGQPQVQLLIAPQSESAGLPMTAGIQPTPTGPSPLANLAVTTPPSRKNLFGLLLFGAVVMVVLVFFWAGERKRSR